MKYAVLAAMLIATPAMAQDAPPQKEFNLKLNVADINVIAEGLGMMPYNKAAPLMGKLQAQINEQNKPAPTPEVPAK